MPAIFPDESDNRLNTIIDNRLDAIIDLRAQVAAMKLQLTRMVEKEAELTQEVKMLKQKQITEQNNDIT